MSVVFALLVVGSFTVLVLVLWIADCAAIDGMTPKPPPKPTRSYRMTVPVLLNHTNLDTGSTKKRFEHVDVEVVEHGTGEDAREAWMFYSRTELVGEKYIRVGPYSIKRPTKKKPGISTKASAGYSWTEDFLMLLMSIILSKDSGYEVRTCNSTEELQKYKDATNDANLLSLVFLSEL